MKDSGIVPDVIDVAPAGVLEITYPSGVTVEFGNELTPTQVKNEPQVNWDADDNCLYTLLMTDPDATSVREVRHWLVVNIPGNKLSEGKVVAEYIGSGPREGTGLHRYIFLVFKQTETIAIDLYASKRQKTGRVKTNTRDFIAENKLGIPVAGNFYRAQYDDYVPILHSQFND